MKMLRWMLEASLVLGLAQTARAEPAVRATVAEPGAQSAASDQAVAARLQAQFDADSMLRKARISATCRSGVATVKGSVPSQVARERAVEMAQRSDGVVRVDDQLRVSPPKPMPFLP